MIDLLPDFIKNLSILVMLAVGFIYVQPLTESLRQRTARSVFLGILFGLVVVVVMLDPITLPMGATFDPRAGPAILAGVFGGPIAAIVSALIGAAGRYYLVGGPIAVGGAVGFALYGAFGIVIAWLLQTYKIRLTVLSLTLIGMAGTFAVLPAFFVSVDATMAIQIIQNAGPIFIANNVASTIIVGLAIEHARQMSEMKKQLVIRQKEDAKLSLVTRETTNIVIITDEHGVTEYVNSGFVRTTGFEPEDIIGKQPGKVLQGKDTNPDTVAYMSKELSAGRGFRVEILNYMKNGKAYWVEITCQPVEEADEPKKFIAIQNDVTWRKQAEMTLAKSKADLQAQLIQITEAQQRMEQQAAELVELAEREADLRGKAEAAEQAKSEFLASMSHEIRTPMTGVMGFADMLLDDDLSPDSAEKVHRIKDATNSLLRIINDILDISKLDAGKLEIESIDFDPRVLANDVVSLFWQTCPKEKRSVLSIDCRFDEHIPAVVSADPTRLRQILINLVGNAVKFTERGAVVLSCHLGEVEGIPHLEYRISDTGIGIEAKMLPFIFDKFSQVDASISRGYQGTGLGLSICKRLVGLMGGEISAESNPGQGSLFRFRIPFSPASTTRLTAFNETVIAPIDVNKLQQATILVAEDNTINQRIVKAMLNGLGHQAHFVENGRDAVLAVKQQEFDLVLMDVRMPILSGPDATREIRKLPGTKGRIPIIALTADVISENQKLYIDAGMTDCVAKPIERDLLAAAIQTAVTQSDGEPDKSDSVKMIDKTAIPQQPVSAQNVVSYSVSDLAARMMLTEDILIPLVRSFVKSYQDVDQQLIELCRQEQYADAAELAHSVKGVSGNLAADALSTLAADLEDSLRNRQLDRLPPQLDAFSTTLQQAITAMRDSVT